MVKLALALLFAASTIAACTLFDDELPDDACVNDEDCFRAQGEVCRDKRCVTSSPVDAGVDAP